MKKKNIIFTIILMAVGFAAVSSTLYINGSTTINPNNDDFRVYYSDAYVNGVQDTSVVVDDTHIKFTTELSTLGEKYVLDYDVTNGSKNYDAELEMVCTGGNEYLTVTNEFDDDSILEALKTRKGNLKLELVKSYIGDEDLTVTIECTINANAIERDTLGEGTPASPVEPVILWTYVDSDNDGIVSIGDSYTLKEASTEKFNVIGETADSYILLASKGLDENYRQAGVSKVIKFGDVNGWEWQNGPSEVELEDYDLYVNEYINEYVSYLKTVIADETITGSLITLSQLGNLGCVYTSDYSHTLDETKRTCVNSENYDWLINGEQWWTRSVYIGWDSRVWAVRQAGVLSNNGIGGALAVRPTITISKSTMNKLEIG